MGVCTGISALQLGMVGGSFLLAALCLDVFWVKLPEELHNGDIAQRRGGHADDLGQRVWVVAAASIC